MTAVATDLRMFLFENEDDEFLGSLYRQLVRKGGLSERQVAAAERSRERQAEWAAQRAAEAEALENVEPLVEGKRHVEGTVLSVRDKVTPWGMTLKMTVRQDDGNKVWGTVPRALENLDFENTLVGSRVEFDAEVDRSDTDPHFGFFKRPKNAKAVPVVRVPEVPAEEDGYVEWDREEGANVLHLPPLVETPPADDDEREDEAEFTIESLARQHAEGR